MPEALLPLASLPLGSDKPKVILYFSCFCSEKALSTATSDLAIDSIDLQIACLGIANLLRN